MDRNPKELYREVILIHNREPFHSRKAGSAAIVIEAYNPLCGDQFKLYLDVEAGRVEEVYFHGYGCAISKASTSVLVKKIRGLTLEEIRGLAGRFFEVVKGGETTAAEADEELQAFAAARDFPARLQCATLSWDALLRYLDEKEAEGH